MRALLAPPVRWANRPLAQGFPAAFLHSFQAEAFLSAHAVEGLWGAPAFHEDDATRLRKVILLVAAPYPKLMVAQFSERIRITSELLRDGYDPCSLDLQAVAQAAEDAMPRGSLWARGMPPLTRTWGFVTWIRLDRELTRLVIDARRDSGDIVHAHALPPVPSTVCKGISWIRTSSGDGRVTISAKPALTLSNQVGTREWTFTFGPAS